MGNDIFDNLVQFNNKSGMYLHSSNNNSISDNIISENLEYGIDLRFGSKDNDIFDNEVNFNSKSCFRDNSDSNNYLDNDCIEIEPIINDLIWQLPMLLTFIGIPLALFSVKKIRYQISKKNIKNISDIRAHTQGRISNQNEKKSFKYSEIKPKSNINFCPSCRSPLIQGVCMKCGEI